MQQEENKYISEDRVSIREVFLRLGAWFKYLLKNWKQVIGYAMVIAALNVTYSLVTKPVYTAETTFVLEGAQSTGKFSSIASAVGVDLESSGQDNALFDTEHIVELYRSYRMLKNTFLTYGEFDGERMRLITRYSEWTKLMEYWREEPELLDLTFELPESEHTVKHDSLLMEVIERFKKNNMAVDKVNRQLSVMSVRVSSKDQKFAKIFDENLVETVNEFYAEVKTKKTGNNLAVLGKQADSVRKALDLAVAHLAVTSSINRPKAQIDVEALGGVYQEILKNLEIAKIGHRNNMPLIQLVDEPVLPLPDNKPKRLILLIVSCFLGGFLTVGFFTCKLVYQRIMHDPKFR